MSAPSHYENDAEFEADDENNGVKIAGSPNSTNMKLKVTSVLPQQLRSQEERNITNALQKTTSVEADKRMHAEMADLSVWSEDALHAALES